MRVDFDIQAKHFKNGVSGDASSCVVARALQDAGFANVSVTTGNSRVTKQGVEYRAPNSQRIQNLINEFDEEKRPVLRRLPNNTRASLKRRGFSPALVPGRYRLDFVRVEEQQ